MNGRDARDAQGNESLPAPTLVFLPQVASTMDEARARAADPHCLGVRAGYQTQGRGRSGAPWLAPPDTCLLVTYILRGEACRPEHAGHLAFAAAVAVSAVLQGVTGLTPGVKWTNDVLLAGRKAAGILIETGGGAEPFALVGIGLNVNVAHFPTELADTATSLLRETGREWEVDALESSLRRALVSAAKELAQEGFPVILTRWRQYDVTAGRAYRAVIAGQVVDGMAVGVSETGALRLMVDDTGTTIDVLSATSL